MVYEESVRSGFCAPEVHPGVQGRGRRVGDQLGSAGGRDRPGVGYQRRHAEQLGERGEKNGTIKEKPLNIDERARLKELEAELRRVKMERDLLKKAAAWFASQSL